MNILLVSMILLLIVSMIIMQSVDATTKAKNGNNGRCKKLQKSLPEELRDFQGCKDTFTGKGHKNPPILN